MQLKDRGQQAGKVDVQGHSTGAFSNHNRDKENGLDWADAAAVFYISNLEQ